MSNVIDFLEKMGQDAQLRHASQDEVELALANTQIDRGLKSAILAKDPSQLQELLRQGPLFCIQMPGNEDQEEREDEDKDTEESPSREGEKLVLPPLFCDVASVA